MRLDRERARDVHRRSIGDDERRHARVVHAGDRGSEQAGRAEPRSQVRLGNVHVAVSAGKPERRGRGANANSEREYEQVAVITHFHRGLHRRHPRVVHERDSDSGQSAGRGDASDPGRRITQPEESGSAPCDRYQERQCRQSDVVRHLDGQRRGEHAGEMHRPDAAAERHAAEREEQIAAARILGEVRVANEPERHVRGERGEQHGRGHEHGVVLDPRDSDRAGACRPSGAPGSSAYRGAIRDHGTRSVPSSPPQSVRSRMRSTTASGSAAAGSSSGCHPPPSAL